MLDSAEEKALGLTGASSSLDGWVGIASDATLSRQTGGSWSYSPTATPGANQYYLVGVLEHEITEIMGRTSYLDVRGEYGVMEPDPYQSAGVHQTGTGGPAYFSVDNGATDLGNWNTLSSGDIGDWASSAGADALLAFGPPGQINGFSSTDITLLSALGWTAGTNTPVPGNQYVFSAGSQMVNLVRSTDGANLPAAISGDFNLELVASPSGTNYSTPLGYQGVALLPGGSGKSLQLLSGDYEITDNSSGDSITAGSGAQLIVGAPSDTIAGGSGISWMFGAAGQQTICGGAGSNLITGGTGDVIIGSGSGGATAGIAGAVDDAIYGGYGWDWIDASAGSQYLTGGPGHSTIIGGAGDVIFGSTGAGSSSITGVTGDAIMGGSGTDLIDGRAGGQPITGGSGTTTVWAGAGDTVFGALGNLTVDIDHSQFSGAVSIKDTGIPGYDTVIGFSQSAGDRMSFANETATAIDSVIGTVHISNGNTIVTLPDGASLTLVGITHIDSTFFA